MKRNEFEALAMLRRRVKEMRANGLEGCWASISPKK